MVSNCKQFDREKSGSNIVNNYELIYEIPITNWFLIKFSYKAIIIINDTHYHR